MGSQGSKPEDTPNFSGSSAGSMVGPDGAVQLYHSTFTGLGSKGLMNGTGYAYNNVFPVLASFTFDVICIFTIVFFFIILMKYKTSQARRRRASVDKYEKLTAEFEDTQVV